MNVVLVVSDPLRYDAFETHFDWLPGLRFENAWASGNRTVPVYASLFTGRYPSEIDVHAGHTMLDRPDPTLETRRNEPSNAGLLEGVPVVRP
jgi:arylsulfatase A-like enzyme